MRQVARPVRASAKSMRFCPSAHCLLGGSLTRGFSSRLDAPVLRQVDRVILAWALSLERAASAWFAGVVLAIGSAMAAAGCSNPVAGPAAAVEDADDDAGEDASRNQDAGADGSTADAVGDAAAPEAGPAVDAPTIDVKPAAEVNTKGCKTDADCGELQVGSCQTAKCIAASGLCEVIQVADGTACADAATDKCKVGAVCKAGACAYSLLNCDDANPCSDDECIANAGCAHQKSVANICLDGSACTTGATCIDGTCKAKNVLVCDDKNACTSDTCDQKLGCVFFAVADASACDDGKVCVEAESCFQGKCAGKPKVCATDETQCKLSVCVDKNNQGCTTQALVGLPCDDGKACTGPDVCNSSATCAGQVIVCDDKNGCTDDACDTKFGCKFNNSTKPCSGTDPCLAVGLCGEGTCTAAAVNCDDGNLCTSNSCDKILGCKAKNVSAPCFDGDVCSENDACDGGVCKAGSQAACDDGNPCTTDSCLASGGCKQAVAAFGASCGSGKQCAVGLCLATECGDGWCAPGETASACLKDCPEEGGACKADDGPCLAACKAGKCSAADTACKGQAGCGTIGSCLAGCANDLKCQVGCLQTAASKAFAAYLGYDQCMQAFCIQDFWLGGKCSGGGPQYVACVQACEGSMCKLLGLQCQASAGCSEVRACLQACTAGEPGQLLACIGGCKAKGNAADVLINADLDTCSSKYCQ